MHGSCSCRGYDDDEHNGSRAVSLLLRLANLALAITSAVVMATASSCTVISGHDVGATATTTAASVTVTFKDYAPFVYLVWANIAAAVLQSAGIYLQLAGNGGDEGPRLPARILLVIIDGAVQALLYSATGAAVAAEAAYGHEIKACAAGAGTGGGRFCDEVRRSTLFSLGASLTVSLAAVAKDVPLPFSVWPASSSSSSHC